MLASKLVLGTVQFGLPYGINNATGIPSFDETTAILDVSYKNGITLLDTAEAYGASQEVIGKYHRLSGNRFNIITKLSLRLYNSLNREFTRLLESDLDQLQVSTLYAYMFHSIDDYRNNQELLAEIWKYKEQGVIERVGVSVYNNAEALEVSANERVDLVQLPFNLLDNEIQRSHTLEKLKERGVEVHTRSTFLQGLFFKDTQMVTGKLKPLVSHLNKLKNISYKSGVSMENLALHYVLSKEYIDKILIGVESVEQIQRNLQAINANISPEVFKYIDGINVEETELLSPANWK